MLISHVEHIHTDIVQSIHSHVHHVQAKTYQMPVNVGAFCFLILTFINSFSFHVLHTRISYANANLVQCQAIDKIKFEILSKRMVFARKLYSFCLNASHNRPTHVSLHSCWPSNAALTLHLRTLSSKKSSDGNYPKKKTKTNQFVDTQNDFVTHQLNTSFAAHLKRQQKILNQMQNENEEEKRKLLKQTKHKVRDDDDYGRRSGYTNDSRKVKRAIIDESSSSRFQRKSNYRQIDTDGDVDDDLNNCDTDSDFSDVEQLEIPNWPEMKLNKINRDVYRPSQQTQNRHDRDVDAFRNDMHVKIDSNAPKPIFKFNELNSLSEIVSDALDRRQFSDCTPIQAQGLPLALSGVNMLAISQSG